MRTAAEHATVLVADDDEDMLALVVTTLRTDGYTVVEARDGGELLDYLVRGVDDPSRRPDVVVTDVRMPSLSGLGVLDAMRKARVAIPVVVMTAFADDSVRTIARRLGAVGLLKKPFDVDDLRTAVWNAHAAFVRARDAAPTDRYIPR